MSIVTRTVTIIIRVQQTPFLFRFFFFCFFPLSVPQQTNSRKINQAERQHFERPQSSLCVEKKKLKKNRVRDKGQLWIRLGRIVGRTEFFCCRQADNNIMHAHRCQLLYRSPRPRKRDAREGLNFFPGPFHTSCRVRAVCKWSSECE